ncbi:metallophosphoesterase [Myxococcota bacterium]
MRVVMSLLVGLMFLAEAEAAGHASWEIYIKKNRYNCPGPFDTLTKSRHVSLSGKTYEHTGYRMVVKNPDADSVTKIGVVSAIKDVTEGTKKNLADAIAWFKKEKVEWVVANGDLALEEFDLEEVLDLLGEGGLPVLIVLGNSESKGSFARTYKDRMKKYPNLINGVLIRQVVADDVEFWTMPGYFDRRFAHAGAACAYKEDDVEALRENVKPGGKAPVVLVSHGPPHGKGKQALDWVTVGENVGDESMNDLIKKANISFGLFGHILEAGGTGVGNDMKTPIKPDKEVNALYVNAGSLSGDPWGMNDGSTSYGMAILVTIDGTTAKYAVKRYKNRIED